MQIQCIKCSTFSWAALLGICILSMWCNVPESELLNGSRHLTQGHKDPHQRINPLPIRSPHNVCLTTVQKAVTSMHLEWGVSTLTFTLKASEGARNYSQDLQHNNSASLVHGRPRNLGHTGTRQQNCHRLLNDP